MSSNYQKQLTALVDIFEMELPPPIKYSIAADRIITLDKALWCCCQTILQGTYLVQVDKEALSKQCKDLGYSGIIVLDIIAGTPGYLLLSFL